MKALSFGSPQSNTPHASTRNARTRRLRLVAGCMGTLFLLVGLLVAPQRQANSDTTKQPWAVLHTDRGAVVIELYERYVPKSVKHFIDLATGAREWVDPKTKQKVKRPFYDGLTFHRILPTYLVQGGCPLGNGRGGPGFSANDEFHPNLRHQTVGMVGFSNVGPDTNGSQFYITLRSTPWLDPKEIKGRYCENFTTPVGCLSDQDCADYARQFPSAADGSATCKERIVRRGYTIFGKVVHGMDVINTIAEAPLDSSSQPSSPIQIKRVKIQIGKAWKRTWLRLSDDD